MESQMPQYSPPDQFVRRVRWLTFAVIAVLFAWHALSWADRALQKESATPRAVTARGDLAADSVLRNGTDREVTVTLSSEQQ